MNVNIKLVFNNLKPKLEQKPQYFFIIHKAWFEFHSMLIYDVKKYTQAVQTQGVDFLDTSHYTCICEVLVWSGVNIKQCQWFTDWQLLLYSVFLGGILPVHLFVAVY